MAHTAMKLTGLSAVTLCPWALREGVLLRHIEDGPGWWAEITRLHEKETAPAEAVPLRVAGPGAS